MTLWEDVLSTIAIFTIAVILGLALAALLQSWPALDIALRVYIAGRAPAWTAFDMLCLCIFIVICLVVLAWGVSALLELFNRLNSPTEGGAFQPPQLTDTRVRTHLSSVHSRQKTVNPLVSQLHRLCLQEAHREGRCQQKQAPQL